MSVRRQSSRKSRRSSDSGCTGQSANRRNGSSRWSPASCNTTQCRPTGRHCGAFRYHVIDLRRRTLRRRGQKRRMTWRGIGKLADDWLPKPRILHPWPNQRFAVKHPRREPDAGCVRKAGMSLPVQVWSMQSLASRTGASLMGVTVTWGPERRQWSDGVWD